MQHGLSDHATVYSGGIGTRALVVNHACKMPSTVWTAIRRRRVPRRDSPCAGATPIDKTQLRALADEDDAALSTRFFAAKPCDDAARALARGDGEAAAAIAASGRFALLSRADADAALDALDAVIHERGPLAARRAADDTRRDGLTDAPSASDDERWPRRSLLRWPPRWLRCCGRWAFRISPRHAKLRRRGGPRAAAAIMPGLARVRRPRAAHRARGSGDTLVVAFSSLGWHGLLRAEWRGVLRAIGRRNVAHALDTAKSWYCSNPTTGRSTTGVVVDATLAGFVRRTGRSFCWATRWAGRRRSASQGTPAVVAFVPQIDLRDFPAPCDRADFDDAKRERLRDDIVNAVDASDARISIHVGRDADDLQQLTVPTARGGVRPLTKTRRRRRAALARRRDGDRVVDDDGFRVVKHDVEGRAIAGGPEAAGALGGGAAVYCLSCMLQHYQGMNVDVASLHP